MAQMSVRMRAILNEIGAIAVILGIVFLIRTYVFGLYQVPTGSMEPTMLVGERFFADKLSFYFRKPRQGEIIALNDPNYTYSKNPVMRLLQDYVIPATDIEWLPQGPQNWTKRIIATPGQTVTGKIEDGKPVVYVDGKKLNEPYVNPYPLIHLCPIDIEKCRKELVEGVRSGALSWSQAEKIFIDQQNRFSADWKTFDPNKPFSDQPFYRINPAHIVKDEDGDPEIRESGTPLEARRVCPKAHNDGTNYWACSDEFNVELGPTQYWLMGDNRLGSWDSRYFGPVDERLIHGRIIYRIWSNDSNSSWWIFDLIFHPIEFFKNMRWERSLQTIH